MGSSIYERLDGIYCIREDERVKKGKEEEERGIVCYRVIFLSYWITYGLCVSVKKERKNNKERKKERMKDERKSSKSSKRKEKKKEK